MITLPIAVVFGAVSALLILNHPLPATLAQVSPVLFAAPAPTLRCAGTSLPGIASGLKSGRPRLACGPDGQAANTDYDRPNGDLMFARKETY